MSCPELRLPRATCITISGAFRRFVALQCVAFIGQMVCKVMTPSAFLHQDPTSQNKPSGFVKSMTPESDLGRSRRTLGAMLRCASTAVCALLLCAPVLGAQLPLPQRPASKGNDASSSGARIHHQPSGANELPPSLTDGRNEDGHLTNLCRCDCCYDVLPGGTQCVSMSEYEVDSCGACDTDSCSSQFSKMCSVRSATTVRAACVERQAIALKLLPLLFVATAIGLVLYGVLTLKDPTYRSPDPAAYSTIPSLQAQPLSVTSPTEARYVAPLLAPRTSPTMMLEPGKNLSGVAMSRSDDKPAGAFDNKPCVIPSPLSLEAWEAS
jgi:hypothetical protein